MPRPYSYRYPFDNVRTVMEPWRDTLGEDFDRVCSLLVERDRALEDYLNLGVGQGQIALAQKTNSQTNFAGNNWIDIVNLSATFTLPAKRKIKFSWYINVENQEFGGFEVFSLRLLDQANNIYAIRSTRALDGTGGPTGDNSEDMDGDHQTTLAAGTWTFRLQGNSNGAVSDIDVVQGATNIGFLMVEDIGPAD